MSAPKNNSRDAENIEKKSSKLNEDGYKLMTKMIYWK